MIKGGTSTTGACDTRHQGKNKIVDEWSKMSQPVRRVDKQDLELRSDTTYCTVQRDRPAC